MPFFGLGFVGFFFLSCCVWLVWCWLCFFFCVCWSVFFFFFFVGFFGFCLFSGFGGADVFMLVCCFWSFGVVCFVFVGLILVGGICFYLGLL